MRQPSDASRPKARGTRPNEERGLTFVVGLISDTHGLLRAEVVPWFAGADVIAHAGDVGGHAVLAALAKIAPVEAVSGNVDLVFGHTHQAALLRQGNRLVVNPGAAGPRRFRLQPSIAKLVVSGRHADVEFLPLPG